MVLVNRNLDVRMFLALVEAIAVVLFDLVSMLFQINLILLLSHHCISVGHFHYLNYLHLIHHCRLDLVVMILYLMSCNLDGMTVKCVFHLTVHATTVCCDAVGHFVMHGLVAVVAAVEAPVQFCGLVDVQFVGAVAGSVIVKLVADLEFQYLLLT